MFLDADNSARLGRGGRERFGVDRLDRMDAENATENASLGQDIRGQESLSKNSAGSGECHVRSVANRSNAARSKNLAMPHSYWRRRFIKAQIGRASMREKIAGGLSCFP